MNEQKVIMVEKYPETDMLKKSQFKKYDFSVRDLVYIALVTLFCVGLSVFGICRGMTAGFTISAILLTVIMSIFLKEKGSRRGAFAWVSGIFLVLLSIPFAITSNASVLFWCFVLMLILSAYWYLSKSNATHNGEVENFLKNIFLLFFGLFGKFPKTLASVFSSKKIKSKSVLNLIIGLSCAFPVLLIIVPLLMSSDEAFSGLAKLLFENCIFEFFNIILGLTIAIFVVSLAVSISQNDLKLNNEIKIKSLDTGIIISFISAISVCYVTYLFSQLAYFFSAFSGFLPKNYKFNVATYARRGFFEMSIIAAINLILIFLTIAFSKKRNGKIPVITRIFTAFIGVFTLIIIATALSKMFLYINDKGMTVLRITTSSFMIFMAIVFLAVIAKVFIPKIKVVKTALVTASLILLVLGTVNVNKVVGEYNYNAYKSGKLKEIDIETIYKLGDEGVPYLTLLAKEKDEEVSREANDAIVKVIKYRLYNTETSYEEENNRVKLSSRKYEGINCLKLSRIEAYEALEEYLKTNKTF